MGRGRLLCRTSIEMDGGCSESAIICKIAMLLEKAAAPLTAFVAKLVLSGLGANFVVSSKEDTPSRVSGRQAKSMSGLPEY